VEILFDKGWGKNTKRGGGPARGGGKDSRASLSNRGKKTRLCLGGPLLEEKRRGVRKEGGRAIGKKEHVDPRQTRNCNENVERRNLWSREVLSADYCQKGARTKRRRVRESRGGVKTTWKSGLPEEGGLCLRMSCSERKVGKKKAPGRADATYPSEGLCPHGRKKEEYLA